MYLLLYLNNKIESDGLKELCKNIKFITNLSYLNIENIKIIIIWNRIEGEGTKIIEEMKNKYPNIDIY